MSVRTVRSPSHALLLAVILATVLATSASSQQIDIGALEQLFGEPVTTSATGKPQRASDVPANMEIITQDDIRRSGAASIPDALQFVTGVDVRRYGLADAEVGIRGYNQAYNPRLLVLVNGRQVYSEDFGHVSWPTIPVQLEEIRQIEVIKGPNSALYGFNAVSGVINIITYDPLRDRVNAATLRGGTQDYVGGSVVGTGRIGDDVGLRLSAGGFRAHDFEFGSHAPVDAVERNLSPLIGTFNIDARARVAPGIETFIEASMGDSRFAEKVFTDTFDTIFSRTNSLRLGVNADTRIGLLSLSAYRNEQLNSVEAASLSGLANWVNEDVYVVQASDLVKLGTDHTVRVGLEYRNNAIRAPGFVRGTIGYEVYAASLMWDWAIAPRLSLTNAVRVDDLYLSYSGSTAPGSGFSAEDYNHAGFAVPSFNSGLVFKATDIDTLRLTVARGVQVPSLVDFGLQFPASQFSPAVVAGNPNVHPSTVDNVEFDYDRAVPVIGSTMRTALFAQRTRDIISEPFAATPIIGPLGLPVLLTTNVGGSDAVGMEIGIKGHSTSGFRWNASYAFVETTDDTVLSHGTVGTNPVDFGHSVPRHVLTAGIGYTRERLELDLMGRWQSSYRDFQTTATGPFLEPIEIRNYLTLNAHVGYRLTDNLSLGFTAQQFNRSHLLQAAGPPLDRRLFVSVTTQF
jgi:outer membrane receptor for ferrienterochelin and colicins